MKSGGGKSQRREEKKKEDQRKNQKKDDADARKGRKAGYDCVFPPEGRKVGSLKRRVRRHLARWGVKNCTPLWREHISKSKCTKHVSFGEFLGLEMSKKCTPLWREAHFEVNMYKARRNTFGSWDVGKVHAVVARSTRRFCAKHTSKSTCTKHLTLGNIFGEVEMLKKCTSLWRDAHFPSQNVQSTTSLRHFWKLRCSKVHAVVARSTFRCQKCQKLTVSRATFGRSDAVSHGRRKGLCTFTLPKVSKMWWFCGSFNCSHHTLHSTPPHYTTTTTTATTTTLHYTNYITLHSSPLHYTTLNFIQLHCTTLTTTTATTQTTTTLHYTTLH